MDTKDMIDLIANVLAIAVMAVKAYKAAKPWVMLRVQSLWQHTRQAAARAVPHWRKAIIALTVAWSAGGLMAYGFTGGMDGAAPLWAQCWLGSVIAAGVLGCIAWEGWLMGRWTIRQT